MAKNNNSSRSVDFSALSADEQQALFEQMLAARGVAVVSTEERARLDAIKAEEAKKAAEEEAKRIIEEAKKAAGDLLRNRLADLSAGVDVKEGSFMGVLNLVSEALEARKTLSSFNKVSVRLSFDSRAPKVEGDSSSEKGDSEATRKKAPPVTDSEMNQALREFNSKASAETQKSFSLGSFCVLTGLSSDRSSCVLRKAIRDGILKVEGKNRGARYMPVS